MDLLRALLPGTVRVAVLVNPANAMNAETTLRDAEVAARTMGLQMQTLNASTSREINAASQVLGASGPTRFSLVATAFLSADVSKWSIWRRATQSPQHMQTGNFPKSAG